MSESTEELLEDRNTAYGNAWALSGHISRILRINEALLLERMPEAHFPIMLIINKCIRAMTTPYNKDHWRDIIGYATLVLNYLEATDVPTK